MKWYGYSFGAWAFSWLMVLVAVVSMVVLACGCSTAALANNTKADNAGASDSSIWLDWGGEWETLPLRICKPTFIDAEPSVETWNRWAGRAVFVIVSPEQECDVVIQRAVHESAGALADAAVGTCLETGKRCARVRFYPVLWRELVNAERVLVHELGHVLGIGHDKQNPHNVMFVAYAWGAWGLPPEWRRQVMERYRASPVVAGPLEWGRASMDPSGVRALP